MAKHIIFISEKENFQDNDYFIRDKLLKDHYKNSVYEHVTGGDIFDANLVIFFGENLLKSKFPSKDFNSFFKDDEGQCFYSISNYYEFKHFNKNEETLLLKELKLKLNAFFKRFALTRVTDKNIFYKDLYFKKIKERNEYNSNFKFIEDENGEYDSYDGKKLKKVTKDFVTFKPTYDGHLRQRDVFYYENYPKIAHSKLIHYITYDIENNLSLDVDNTPEPIISIAAYSNIYKKNFVWLLKKNPTQYYDENKFKNDKIIEFNDENKMLNHFWNSLKFLEVDLMSGWHSSFFDIPYLINRSKKLDVDYTVFLGNTYETIGKDGEKTTISDDIILWDYERYMKWITKEEKPVSWSLGEVSNYLFGESKKDIDEINILWDKEDLTEILEYNIQDVYLTEKINIKQKLVEFPMLYQKIVPQSFENVYFNSRFLENMIHQRFNKVKFPTKEKREEKTFIGALVLDSVSGRYNNVSVFDYASLYPSIIVSLNLSKDTILENVEFNPDKHVKVDGVIFRTDKEGIIPQLSRILINERSKINKKKMQYDGNSSEFKILNDMETTFKITSNALYGVLGYPGFIMYDRRVAASVTFVAREILKFVKIEAEKLGYIVLSGDTDSLHIQITANSFEDSIKKSKDLEKLFNSKLPEFLSKFTNNKKIISSHIMKIAFEKSFSKLLLSSAKKKQVGFLKYFKGKILKEELLYIKGFESKKDDTPIFFKKVLEELYKNVLNNYDNFDKLNEFVKDVKKRLKEETVDNLIIRKRMSKKFEDYDSNPIHITALKNSNMKLKRGETVKMVFVDDDRKVIHYDPLLNLKFKIDYNRYFTNFFVKKVELIDENLYYKLFLQKTKLVNMSKENLKRKKTKIILKKIGEK